MSADKAAFVCLSSLTPVAEIETLLRTLPMSIPLVVVKLSDAISSPFKVSVKDLFFRPEKHPVDKLRRPWLISPLRQHIQKNRYDEINTTGVCAEQSSVELAGAVR